MLASAVRLTLATLVLCGVVYPLATTGVGRLLFPAQAQGSLVTQNGRVVGSRLIGQAGTNPGLFWNRPSLTVNAAGQADPYNAAASAGANWGATNRELLQYTQSIVATYRQSGVRAQLPQNLVTPSASGLDPAITPKGAFVQVERIHRATGVPVPVLDGLVAEAVRHPFLVGPARVNVLQLNLALTQWEREHPRPQP